MQLQTIIPIQKELSIHHKNKVMMLGSCFTEHIGRQLQSHKFPTSVNPLGILFNPASLRNTIHRICEKRLVDRSELFEHQGVWNSFDFHSQFAQLTAEDYLQQIQPIIQEAHTFLSSCDYLFITLGTAWIYEHNTTGKVVANCHKIPQNQFTRRRLTVSESVQLLEEIVQMVRITSPTTKVIFTVSPIRHWKDGAHGNQISKSTLLLAVDELISKQDNCYYFPSYEIVMDELRDYRFYANDMLHPNELAQNYIWERFGETYFSKETQEINNEVEQIRLACQHRPFNTNTATYRSFQESTTKKIEMLLQKHPYLSFETELQQLRSI